jgi:pimeloyl-ACP methyl ester carboxylesterase
MSTIIKHPRKGRRSPSHIRKAALFMLGGLGIVFVSWLAVALSCSWTPAIRGPDGKILPGSIASLEKLSLNGREEWVSIRGKDARAPVLLLLAGGPGGTELATARLTLGGLEESFVVAAWDQPGAGKSYGAIDHARLSLDVYIEDGIALIDHLRERFGKEKIYLFGESWGSALGAFIAQRAPERVAALFGSGQMVDFLEADLACYELMLEWAKKKGDAAKARELEAQGPTPYHGEGVAKKLAAFLLDTHAYMEQELGVANAGNTWKEILSEEYTLIDKVNWFRGLLDTLERFYPKLWGIDLRRRVPRLEVPAFFLLGRKDINAPIPLFLDYYRILEAPIKEVVWFENSGHTPWSSETASFIEALVSRARRIESGNPPSP